MMVLSIPHQRSGWSPRQYCCECQPQPLPKGGESHDTSISFLASTHYTNYNPWLFAVNLAALIVIAIIPKLPQVRAWSHSGLRVR